MSEQNLQNHFNEKISKLLKSNSSSDKTQMLNSITDGEISIEQYTMLGIISYMIGMDFTSQRNVLNWSTLKRVNKRLTEHNIDAETLKALWTKLPQLSLERLEVAKELSKGKVDEVITDLPIIFKIRNVISNSIIPVEYAYDANKLMTGKMTYQSMLVFNSLFYEQSDVNGNGINEIVSLLSEPKYQEYLKEASNRFDEIKFALLYNDGILTLREFSGIDFGTPIEDMLFNEELIERLYNEEQQAELDADAIAEKAIEQLVEEVDQEIVNEALEFENSVAPDPSMTDAFFRASLEEAIQRKIKTVDDLIEACELIFTNDEMVESYYKFIKSRIRTNRKPFEEIYPESVTIAEVDAKLTSIIEESQKSYKDIVEVYAQPLKDTESTRIIDLVDKTIRSLSLSNKDAKIYLVQQIAENQIETYKHLHQTISVIETCGIYGNKIGSYVELKEVIESNQHIVEVFAKSVGMNDVTNKLNFYGGLKQFFMALVPTKEVESTESQTK